MKRALLYFLTLCFLQFQFNDLKAQNWNWAKSIGESNGNFNIKSISQYQNNEILVLGEFDIPKLVFGADTLKSNGNQDFFVAVSDNELNFKWIKNYGGEGSEVITKGISDKMGNIYLIGNSYDLNVIIGLDTIKNKGQQDGYIVKLQPNGNVEWTLNIGTIYNDELTGLVLDSNGNAYVSGYTVNSSTEPIETSSFLIKVNPNKNIEWTRLGNSIGGDLSNIRLTIDDDQNLYYTGSLNGNISFIDSTELKSLTSINQSFIVKYNTLGKLEKAIILSEINQILDIKAQKENFYVCGVKLLFLNEDQNEYIIQLMTIKYNNQFDTSWTNVIISPDMYGSDYVKLIEIDNYGNTYVAGVYISDSLYFHTDTLINIKFENYNSLNSFLVKYDSTGKELWVENIRGELINEIKSMFISNNNEVVIAGGFMSKEMTFGDIIVKNESPLIEWTFHGITFYFRNTFSFIASLSDINTRIKENQKVSDFLLYPNPTRDYFNIKSEISNGFNTEVNIYSLDGQLAKSVSFPPDSNKIYIDIDDLMSGIYIVQLKVGNQIAYQRLVKQ